MITSSSSSTSRRGRLRRNRCVELGVAVSSLIVGVALPFIIDTDPNRLPIFNLIIEKKHKY